MRVGTCLATVLLSTMGLSSSALALDLEEQFGHQISDARLFQALLSGSEALSVQLSLGGDEDEFQEDCEAVERLISDESVPSEVIEGLIDETPATLLLNLPVFSSDRGAIWREAFVNADADAARWIILKESGFVPRVLKLQAIFQVPGAESELPSAQKVALEGFSESLRNIPVGDLSSIYDRGQFGIPITSPMVSCWMFQETPSIEVQLRGRALERVESRWQIPEETVKETLRAVAEALPLSVQETGYRNAQELAILIPVLITADLAERYSSTLSPSQLIAIVNTGREWAERAILSSNLAIDDQSIDQLASDNFEEELQTAALVDHSAAVEMEIVE